MLSKACEYCIKAVVFLAQRSKEGKHAIVKEIARAIDSPEAFTAKVLQQLVKGGFISSPHRYCRPCSMNNQDNNLRYMQVSLNASPIKSRRSYNVLPQ
ncbi:Rrf2 family transcriptional regulator [Chitinophaga deserti]|uniref:Rrf2 family transcriptional regulator n=1 Tax=Chitinophaga deserti TaxID=2164099 RepID=UPI000D6CA714|nr:Rrf2 family transcriptional regulator [Chitinophaga deserti]